MGTNYYLETDICECCYRCDERLHIGKSSVGWVFSLRIYPEKRINNLEDWKLNKIANNERIVDEYGREISSKEMLEIITNRNYPHLEDLLRNEETEFIKHGEGTYDLINYEFS